MIHVKFDGVRYSCFNNSRYFLFSSSNLHDELFDYIARDISKLTTLLEQYFAKRMDIATFELSSMQHDNEELEEIKAILIQAHPYYKYEYKNVILNAIGEYFNSLLKYAVASYRMSSNRITQEWHRERFVCLTREVLSKHESYPDNLGPASFFGKFQNWAKDEHPDPSEEQEETFLINVPSQEPIAFINEITTQKMIANMLYFVLDIDAPDIYHLSIPQRAWLYGNTFRAAYSQSMLKVTEQLSFFQQPRFYPGDRTQEAEYAGKLYDIFSPLYALSSVNVANDGIDENMVSHFKTAIGYAEQISSAQVYREYEVDSLRQLLYLEVLTMIQDGTMIRKCKNCGKYFVVTNRKTAYCDRTNESGQLCSAVGSRLSFQKKMANEEELKMYNRAYKTHFARVKSGKMTKAELNEWCAEAKGKLAQVRAGKLDIPTFQTWLKK